MLHQKVVNHSSISDLIAGSKWESGAIRFSLLPASDKYIIITICSIGKHEKVAHLVALNKWSGNLQDVTWADMRKGAKLLTN